MHEMSDALHFASHRLQEFALIFMAIVYILLSPERWGTHHAAPGSCPGISG